MKDVVLNSLATYRITKLVIDDELLREPREAILIRVQETDGPVARKLEYFLSCPWCISIWAAGGLLLLLKLVPSIAEPLRTVLAASAATGIISSRI